MKKLPKQFAPYFDLPFRVPRYKSVKYFYWRDVPSAIVTRGRRLPGLIRQNWARAHASIIYKKLCQAAKWLRRWLTTPLFLIMAILTYSLWPQPIKVIYAEPSSRAPAPQFVAIAHSPSLPATTLTEEPTVAPPAPVSPPPVYTTPTPAPVYGDARSYALSQVGSAQFSCLDALWNKESGWRINAYNPSGAYGIPQSLPGSKMATFGADWRTNPITQVNWGLWYIATTYLTPCGAWAHSQAFNWY